MKEYEISSDNKNIGKVKIYDDISHINSLLIKSKINTKYSILKDNNYQTYIINITINDEDELYNKISIYKDKNIIEEIERIKEYNKIKHITKNTTIYIIIPSIYLKKFNINLDNIDLTSVLYSKINFVKKVLIEKKYIDLKDKLNDIIINYNNMKNSKEYEFLTDEEKNIKIKIIIEKINNIITYIEKNTSYKYGQNFITPIKINN